MYKSKLQILCHRRYWELPEYTTVKHGPAHMTRFTASVNVNGEVFETPALCKSAKDAQNTAARIAYNHLNFPPPPTVDTTPTSSSVPVAVDPQFCAVPPAVPLPAVSSVAVPPAAPLPTVSSVAVPPAVPLPTVSSVAPPPKVPPVAVHDSPSPSSLPTPGNLVTKNDPNTKPASGEVLQQNCEDGTQTSMVYRIAIGPHDKLHKDILHMYKNQLQQYGQKKNLGFPVYTAEAEGPPHARRFRSRVSLDGKSYETMEFFHTLKEAEQAAAKVACQVLSVDVIQEDGGFHKNLLQEFAQKKGLVCPSYETASFGLPHRPLFSSTVEIGSSTFQGAVAKTKKQAEMNAAKVAYCALTEGDPATESSRMSSIKGCAAADNFSQNIQPIATIKKHQDAIDEEAREDIKRAKSLPENTSHSKSQSDDTNWVYSEVEKSTSAEVVTEQPFGNNKPLRAKTVVVPFNSRLAMPEGASVMPYSNNQWVAYKVKLDKEPAA